MQTGSISLVDITGKTIFLNDNVPIEPGSQQCSFTKEQLHVNSTGIYFFKIIIANNVIQKKIVFQDWEALKDFISIRVCLFSHLYDHNSVLIQ